MRMASRTSGLKTISRLNIRIPWTELSISVTWMLRKYIVMLFSMFEVNKKYNFVSKCTYRIFSAEKFVAKISKHHMMPTIKCSLKYNEYL